MALGICCVLAGSAAAQRGGGGHGGGGGMHGGMGGGGFRGGGFGGGGFRGGFGGGFRGFGFRNFGFRNFGFRNGFYGGYYWPYWGYGGYGYGLAYWPDYDYYDYPYDYGYPYGYPGYGSAGYGYGGSQPNVTVIYPPATAPLPQTVYVATPSIHEYDENGREIIPSTADRSDVDASPIYLIAFKDHVIRAASSYRVEGKTLHYVTLENEARNVSLDTVDRGFSLQLNRERRVPFQLPQ
jgi:hypothetical protein